MTSYLHLADLVLRLGSSGTVVYVHVYVYIEGLRYP